MRVEPLEPFGARLHDLAVGAVSRPVASELRVLLATHGVLVLRDQGHAGNEAFVAFLRSLGASAFTVGEQAVDGFPELNVVSNVGRTTPPRSSFHVDTSYVAVPPAYTALRAVTVPRVGGETLFTDQYRAYRTLDPALQALLGGRTMRHIVTGVEPGDAQEHAADHPIFRPHPVTGTIALYLTSPARCASISGLGQDESDAVVQQLFEHATREDGLLRHAWRHGDVVIWDNACVLHRADHTGVVGDRVMHRGMVAGESPARQQPARCAAA